MPANNNSTSGSSTAKPTAKNMIKDYKITAVIGEGGMGKVYRAIHPTLKREIILKELKIRDKETRDRFLREATVMLDFRHENIVQFYDHFKEGTSTYIAMEYVRGGALNNIIQSAGKIAPNLALFILYQAALGLYHAHTKKVVHRDVKPHNILISENGDVKIIDFGIAAQKSENQKDNNLTATGTIIGTPAYMSPEQFSSSKEVSYQSDIYSLGVVFYEMITGIRPFKNEFSSEVMDAISRGKYKPVKKIVKGVPGIVNKVLAKSFNPNVKKRYKTLYPLIKTLKSYFSKFNVYELKASLKLLVKGEKNERAYPYYTRHKESIKRKRTTTSIVLLLLLISCVSFYVFKTGKIYETLLSGNYGKIIFSFNKANMNEENIFIKIDNVFEKAKFKNGQTDFSKVYYLTKGYHEISINSGSYKTTRKINVIPYNMQSKNKETKDGEKIHVTVHNLMPKEVMLSLRFWNQLKSDEYLFQFDNYSETVSEALKNEETAVIIWDAVRNRNITLKDYVTGKLSGNAQAPFYSNKEYAFIVTGFEKDGIKYDTKRFKLKFGLDERTVVAHIPLAPTPSLLIVNSDSKSLPLTINGDTAGYIYDKTDGNYYINNYGTIKPVKNGTNHKFIYRLPPGKIGIRVGDAPKIIEINLNSEENYTLNVTKTNGKYVY